jgi:GH43 family beta-xylosidase
MFTLNALFVRPYLIVFVLKALVADPVGAATFRNPIVPDGQDPWVVQWQSTYLYCWSEGAIKISQAARLQDIGSEPAITIWTPPAGQPYSQNVWAPELHFLQGKWYVYFAADDGTNDNHRMYVLESATNNPFGPYTCRGKIFDPTDKWAIDGTVLDVAGQLYCIWSGWEENVNVQQNLYIAPMSNPWTISGNRTVISQPLYTWERKGGPAYINEGPEILTRNGRIHIIYSASGSWTDDYCLGRISLTGTNVLDPAAWVKHPTPVFAKTSKVFGPGHASFVKSTDYTEDWIVYHAAKKSGAGWNRDVRIQEFGWNPDDTPDFGTPIAAGIHLTDPSGSPYGVTYEAEQAVVNHAQIVSRPGASGQAKVGYIDFNDSYVEFTVDVAKAGQYRLYVRYGAGSGAASHSLSVNGTSLENLNYPVAAWDNWQFQTNTVVSLLAGTNQIRFGKASGYAELDFLGVNRGPDEDTDADDLSDSWERTYFGHLYEPGGAPGEDCDGDGQSTLREYIADTDPTNPNSFLCMSEIKVSKGNVVVYWRGGILATQFLERCNGLTPTGRNWSVVFTNGPPTGTLVNWMDSLTTQSSLFYRVRATR